MMSKMSFPLNCFSEVSSQYPCLQQYALVSITDNNKDATAAILTVIAKARKIFKNEICIIYSLCLTIIQMMSELGRLMGIIERGEWNCIGKKFDWFVNRSEGKIKKRLNNSLF